MPRPQFVNGNFYHVYNRGVLKQPIFLDGEDYVRFVHDLYEFNDIRNAVDPRLLKNRSIAGDPISVATEIGSPNINPREPVVGILAWCLIPNHFHLLLNQLQDGGISYFMQKLGIGFTTYMNKKYERTGHLFQGRFKAKHIGQESYFLHISRYIHLNPVDLIEPGWKEEGIKNWDGAHKFLEDYKWSSYQDWIGKKNFPSLLNLKGMEGVFEGVEKYRKFMEEWAVGNYGKIKSIVAG